MKNGLIATLFLVLTALLIYICYNFSIKQENSEANAIGIIGGADGPTAIFINAGGVCKFSNGHTENGSDMLFLKGLEMMKQSVSLTLDTAYIQNTTKNTAVLNVIQSLGTCSERFDYKAYKIPDLRPFIRQTTDNITDTGTILEERLYRSIPMQINAQGGSANLAATSLLTYDDVFHNNDIDQPCIILYSFDRYCCMVLFIPKKEHIVSAYATFIVHSRITAFETEEDVKEFFHNTMGISNINVKKIY